MNIIQLVAIDTNVLVRLITGDDEKQYQKVRRLFEQEVIFVSDTVMLETAWVLRRTYQFEPPAIVDALRKILGLPNVRVTDIQLLTEMLQWVEEGLEFADALHLAQCQMATVFYTFDRQFSRRSHGLGNCPVKEL